MRDVGFVICINIRLCSGLERWERVIRLGFKIETGQLTTTVLVSYKSMSRKHPPATAYSKYPRPGLGICSKLPECMALSITGEAKKCTEWKICVT
jgi:hypothetical protein